MDLNCKGCQTKDEKTIIDMLERRGRIEVVAPTGTGKTVLANELAENNKTLIVVPYNSQLVNYNGCNVLTPDNKFDFNRSNVGVVDECVKYMSRLDESWTIIIDETHLIIDDKLRKSCRVFNDKIQQFKGKVIGFTAIAGLEDEIIGYDDRLVFYKERKPLYAKWYDVKWPVSQIPKFINKDRTTIVFSDAHNRKLYDNWIAKNGQGSAACLRSDTQDTELFKRTIEEQRLVAMTNFSTSILCSGINLNNEEPVTVIIETNQYIDYAYIVQAIGRFRKSEDIEIIIINNVSWRLKSKRTSPEILAKQGTLGKQEAINIALNNEFSVNESAKHITIEKLTHTGYINVIDYGELIEDYPIDYEKKYVSDKIILDIISNENYSTDYDKSCSRYEKEYKIQLKILEIRLGKKSIREYVRYRSECSSIQMDTIITELYIIFDIEEYTNEELKDIRDDWRGFVKKTVGNNIIDPISYRKIKHRTKFLSDILNNMDVNIDYDNGVVFDAESALKTAITLSRIDAETRRETRKAASSKGGKISSPKKAITVQYLGELDIMDEELIKNNGIFHFESKGVARVQMELYAKTTYSTKTFSKFIKGEKCKIDKLWRLVSVEKAK